MVIKNWISFSPALDSKKSLLSIGLLCAGVGNIFAIPAKFKLDTLASRMDAIAIKTSPDGRVFFTEKKGVIRVIKNNILLNKAFVTIQSRTDSENEKGMTGLALDPDFLTNKYVYAMYIDKDDNAYVRRWTADGDTAMSGSEKEIFNAGASGDRAFHHGGDISFRNDGKLYITRGNREDQNTSKEQTSLFGKILRINKDGTIPTDNPRYTTNSGNARAVYAWGLRNPQTMTFHPETGLTYFVDVSDTRDRDEINELKSGGHYGAYSSGTVNPIFEQGNGWGSAMMGGLFYQKKKSTDKLSFPASYHNKFFWGQYEGTGIRYMNTGDRTITTFDNSIYSPINFDIDAIGSIVLVVRKTQVFDNAGLVLRIRYPEGEVTSGFSARNNPSFKVIDWEGRKGKGVTVRLLKAGVQTISLLDLQGKVLTTVTRSEPGIVELPVLQGNGVHFINWRNQSESSNFKIVL